MKDYRIKKVTENELTRYYPQVKVLWWWYNPFEAEHYYDGGFSTLIEAQKELCDFLQEPVVEYIEFDPCRDCK